MADLVLGDRRESDILLEHRRDTGPFRVAEANHELVVRHRQQQIGDRGAQLWIKRRCVESRQIRLDELPCRQSGLSRHSVASSAARRLATSSLSRIT